MMPFLPSQNALFRAAAHNPKIAKARGIPMSTARRLAGEGIKRNKLSEMAAMK